MAYPRKLLVSQVPGSSSSSSPISSIDSANENAGIDDEWDQLFAEINETDVASEGCEHQYKFKNVNVKFPYKAYTSQLQMMDKIIKGVTEGKNCLLESPTGTGKTAALLCSLLAWQKDCRARRDYCGDVIDAAVERFGQCSCGFIKDQERTKVTVSRDKNGKAYLNATTFKPPQSPLKDIGDIDMSPNTSGATPIKSVPTTPTKQEPSSSSSSYPETPKNKCQDTLTSTFESPFKKLKLQTFEVESVESRYIEYLCGYCARKNFRDRTRPPRIYYCTRTHSQIAQVVSQLKCSSYKNVSMTILASREVTCVSKLKNKLHQQQPSSQKSQEKSNQRNDKEIEQKLTINDICRESRKRYYSHKLWEKEPQANNLDELKLMKQKLGICEEFYSKYHTKNSWQGFQKEGAWDLEDIKKEGVSCAKCPYYGCYEMQEDADIIFCSYNYLIHPFLRKITDIEFANSVLVFDEAHNIEDNCRDAFTVTLDVKTVEEIRGCVEFLLEKTKDRNTFARTTTIQNLLRVRDIFTQWSEGIKCIGSKLKASNDSNSYVKKELLNVLEEIGLTAKSVAECLEKVGVGQPASGLKKDPNNESDFDVDVEVTKEYYLTHRGEERPFKVSSLVVDFLQDLFQPLVYLCEEEQEGIGGVKDFKGFLTRTPNPEYKAAMLAKAKAKTGGRRLTNVAPGVQVLEEPPEVAEFLYRFEIICLNPAVGFRVLRNCAYSIIVASGTLTPLQSFAGELATRFDIKLQADHVIPISNVWAGVVGSGPRGFPLQLTKANQDDTDIQDEVGQIICDICYTVPNGILVFFPSYGLLHKMTERWKVYNRGNSIYHIITQKKLVFEEESKDKQRFKHDMERYKEQVKGGPTWDGCILFAVFRGKISEGIDFADEQARAVITIGIPFSNFTAPSVASKKEYNNMMTRQLPKGELLTGQEWYVTQAFRAMNQGFGRCVRHVNDWGALIMIDQRLNQKRNESYISGWIQKSLQVPAPENFDQVKQNLSQFVERMQRKDRANKKKKKFRIEYERSRPTTADSNCLDDTEIINLSDEDHSPGEDIDNADMDTQILDMPTQIVDMHAQILDMPTQILDIFSQEDIGTVAESSPEYSFREEIDEAMSQQLSPQPSVSSNRLDDGQRAADDEDSDSVSIYGRSPSPSPPTTSTPATFFRHRRVSSASENSDFEMSQIADELESRAEEADVMNVSMSSARESLTDHDVSQGSSISYHSSPEQ